MKIVNRIDELRTMLTEEKTEGKTVGFVPTMGYLHEGHLSLIHAARKDHVPGPGEAFHSGQRS